MNHLGTRRLETDRLALRRFDGGDAPAMYANWASDDEVTRYLTWPTHPSVDATAAYLEQVVASYGDPAVYQWGIELKATGELIGNISAVRCEDAIGMFELGWVLGRRWWGRGIMTEAAGEVVRFFFEEVGANRVCAGHDVNNPRSGRVMEKVGMRFEGCLRGAGRNNCGIVDVNLWAILRQDRRP